MKMQELSPVPILLGLACVTKPVRGYVKWVYPLPGATSTTYNYHDVVNFTWTSNIDGPRMNLWCSPHPGAPQSSTFVYNAQVSANGSILESFPYSDYDQGGVCHMQLGNLAGDDSANTSVFTLTSLPAVPPVTWSIDRQISDGQPQQSSIRDAGSQIRDGQTQVLSGPSMIRDGQVQVLSGPSTIRDGQIQVLSGPSTRANTTGTTALTLYHLSLSPTSMVITPTLIITPSLSSTSLASSAQLTTAPSPTLFLSIATSVTTTIISASPSSHISLSPTAKAGISIGSISSLVLIIFVVLLARFMWSQRRRRRQQQALAMIQTYNANSLHRQQQQQQLHVAEVGEIGNSIKRYEIHTENRPEELDDTRRAELVGNQRIATI